MKTKAVEAPRESLEHFAALAAAVHPDWHQATIRLANTMEGLSEKMSLLLNSPGDFRKNAGEVIDVLIAYLDLVDPDPDLEPNCSYWVGMGYYSRQPAEADECEPPEDDEPELGWTGRTNQTNLGAAGDDRELDTADDEPSLGSLHHDDQARWGYSARADLEQQCEDEGMRE